MNYKPLDLEAAKRGEPIVCRDGTPAKFIAHVPEADATHAVVFMVNGKIRTAELTGWFFGRDSAPSQYDLFMVPVKRKVWINLYSDDPQPVTYCANATRKAADDNAQACDGRIACIEIEFEEGQGL